MIINSFFGSKRSAVLSSKDGILSHHSYRKSGENLSSFIKLICLLIGLIIVFSFESCTKAEDELSNLGNNSMQLDGVVKQKVVAVATPSGWTDQGTNATGGIRRYWKSSNGRSWNVMKVYLPEIRVKPVYKILSGSGTTNPTFQKMNVSSWMSDSQGSNAIMLVNASFFNMNNNWTDIYTAYGALGSKAEVAHPFGYNNVMISWGYASSETGQKRLRINSQLAYIETPNFSAPFETLVTGYDPSVISKDKTSSIGRTMVGIPSNGGNTIYFFVTGSGGGAIQQEAMNALQQFGCTQYVMFDGSGSSQMSWNGSMLVKSSDTGFSRHLPIVLRMDRR